MAVGDTCEFLGRTIRLVSCHNNYCTVDVDGERESLCVASLEMPRVVNGVRVFLADNKGSANTTTNRSFPKIRAARTRDALLALSDPSKPLLDPDLFTFPISRKDGFEWTMGENSHMFAYLAGGLLRGQEHGGIRSPDRPTPMDDRACRACN